MSGSPLRFEGVRFRYPGGGFELAPPDLLLEQGEQVALVGPSGCGKSTAIHLAAGLLQPDAGRVLTLGEELGRLDEDGRRRLRLERVGLVFQEFELLDYLDARENVLVPHLLAGGSPSAAERSRADELLATLGVAHVAGQRPGALSRGERQRVAVARALVRRPGLVLADEPTASLDPQRAREVLELLHATCRAEGASLLTVTHDRSHLERFDRVLDLGEVPA